MIKISQNMDWKSLKASVSLEKIAAKFITQGIPRIWRGSRLVKEINQR